MKSLPILAFLAAAAAFVFAPVNFELAGSVLITCGIASISLVDYARKSRRLQRSAIMFARASDRRSVLRLAA